ncbi:MAG: DUF4445 domain-containing protein [Opitutaceae bacterium]|nr:DUF4445 domain-containing protein [Opitutaceae bacterium]
MNTELRIETTEESQAVGLTAKDFTMPLTEVLASRGYPLNKRCGGRDLCGGCEVGLKCGELKQTRDGVSVPCGDRLRACQLHLVEGRNTTVVIPARSLLKHEPSVVAEFKVNVPWGRNPIDPAACYGAAVDIGTTTVALVLVEMATGKVLAGASDFNAQIRYGEDVLTRIQMCHMDPAAVGELQKAIAVDTIQPLIEEACAAARLTPADLGVMTVAANTTMMHLLAGVDPSPLGLYPFKPAFLEHRAYAPAELNLKFGGEGAKVHLLPGPAAYVGADLSAGVVATGMQYSEGPVIIVDVGTNGEIIAKVGDRLVGTATAAGPAFEGAGLTSGTRGIKGAIERITMSRDPYAVNLQIIGGETRPVGICGSAYVDFLWGGRRNGALQRNGRFADDFLQQPGVRSEKDEFGRRLRLHPNGVSGPVWVSEVDISRLQQAKAAIAAGIEVLLGLLDTKPADVKTLYLCGGFGMHLSLDHAVGCGLLPGFRPDQIQVMGNSSLAGAFLVLNDRSLLAEMKAVCANMESIELNQQPGFEDIFIDHLSLN